MPGSTRFLGIAVAALAAMSVASLMPQAARADGGTPAPRHAPPTTSAPLRTPDVDPAEIEDWPQGQPLPAGYRWGSKPRGAIIQSGGALLVLSYMPSFAIGTINNNDLIHAKSPQSWLFVPVAGPFVLLGETTNSTLQALLVTDGVFQAVGVGEPAPITWTVFLRCFRFFAIQ